jgi:hypothetical protein
MILLEDRKKSGVSFFYPFALRGRSIKIVPWSLYSKWLPLRGISNLVLLLVGGLFLLDNRIYSDTRFNIYAAAVVVSTVARLWFFFPRGEMVIATTTSARLVPLIGLDFSATFFVSAEMQLIFASQPGTGQLGAFIAMAAFAVILFGILTLCPALAFLLGVGKLASQSALDDPTR